MNPNLPSGARRDNLKPLPVDPRTPKRVVFITGAGASCTYGTEARRLPTAAQLKTLIATLSALHVIPTDNSNQHTLEHTNHLRRNVENIKAQFAASGQYSIDRFLEKQNQHRETGKKMIAAMLLPCESAAIRDRSIASGWYQWLFNELNSIDTTTIKAHGLKFITFNYDRTLYYALQTMAINSFGLDPLTARQLVGAIPIFHIYGSLKSEFVFDESIRLFNCQYPLNWVEHSANDISIISYERNELGSSTNSAITSAIKQADVIVFLGFGFDETNLRRLGILPYHGPLFTDIDRPLVFATGYGLGERERDTVRERLLNSTLQPANVDIGLPSMGCEEYLREKISLTDLLAPQHHAI